MAKSSAKIAKRKARERARVEQAMKDIDEEISCLPEHLERQAATVREYYSRAVLAADDPSSLPAFRAWLGANLEALASNHLALGGALTYASPDDWPVFLERLGKRLHREMYREIAPLLFALANRPVPYTAEQGVGRARRHVPTLQALLALHIAFGESWRDNSDGWALLTALFSYPDAFADEYPLDDLYRHCVFDNAFIGGRRGTASQHDRTATKGRARVAPFLQLYVMGLRCLTVPPRLQLLGWAEYTLLAHVHAPTFDPRRDDAVRLYPGLVGLFLQNSSALIASFSAAKQGHIGQSAPMPLCGDSFTTDIPLEEWGIPPNPERVLAAMFILQREAEVDALIGPRGLWWRLPGADRVRAVTIRKVMRRLERSVTMGRTARRFVLGRLLCLPSGGYSNSALGEYSLDALAAEPNRWHTLPVDIRKIVAEMVHHERDDGYGETFPMFPTGTCNFSRVAYVDLRLPNTAIGYDSTATGINNTVIGYNALITRGTDYDYAGSVVYSATPLTVGPSGSQKGASSLFGCLPPHAH